MKPLFYLLIFYVFVSTAYATPLISNFSLSPQNPWLDDNVFISLACTDSVNISAVYADIVGPNVLLPRFDFSQVNETYNLNISAAYFDRTGQFNATVTCININGEQQSIGTGFIVSQLTGIINDVFPQPTNTDDIIKMYVFIKKDDVLISSDVSFNVTLNGGLRQLLLFPLYDTNKGWILKIAPTGSEGFFSLNVIANFQNKSINIQQLIEVTDKINFDITAIDKTWVSTGQDITISISASDADSIINIADSNLDVSIGGQQLAIKSTVREDNIYKVKVTTPELSAGRHDLAATLFYNNTNYYDIKDIFYTIPVEGRFVDVNDKGIAAEMRFFQDGTEKLKLSSNTEGYYTGSLPPDDYDISIKFPSSNILINDADVRSYDNSILYYFVNAETPGIKNAGVHIYKINISFDNAEIEFSYENNVLDESQIKLFKCTSWNDAIMACDSDWRETDYEVDAFRNTVKTEQEDLSAFVIGVRKRLYIKGDFDKTAYNLEERGKFVGFVQDEAGNTVSNATVTLSLAGILEETSSDNNGVFEIKFKAPSTEGIFAANISAEKDLYLGFSKKFNVTARRSKGIAVVFPETIKLEQGENFLQEILIINKGQSDLSGVKIELSDMPASLYEIPAQPDTIRAGEEKKAFVYFKIPETEAPSTTAAKIKVYSSEASDEKIFGLTIEKKEAAPAQQTQQAPEPEKIDITGFFAINIQPKDMEIIALAIFASLLFYFSFKLKRKSKPKAGSLEMKNTLIDIKNQLRQVPEMKYEEKAAFRRKRKKIKMREEDEHSVSRKKIKAVKHISMKKSRLAKPTLKFSDAREKNRLLDEIIKIEFFEGDKDGKDN